MEKEAPSPKSEWEKSLVWFPVLIPVLGRLRTI